MQLAIGFIIGFVAAQIIAFLCRARLPDEPRLHSTREQLDAILHAGKKD